jgi:hypothetical protein
MERNKEKKIKWRKRGGGTFRLKPKDGQKRGQKIKANEEFEAYPSDIPKAFRDTIIPLGAAPPDPEETPVEVEEPDYTLKHRSGGYYHILDANGNVLTETALKKDEALERIEELKAEG